MIEVKWFQMGERDVKKNGKKSSDAFNGWSFNPIPLTGGWGSYAPGSRLVLTWVEYSAGLVPCVAGPLRRIALSFRTINWGQSRKGGKPEKKTSQTPLSHKIWFWLSDFWVSLISAGGPIMQTNFLWSQIWIIKRTILPWMFESNTKVYNAGHEW